MNNLKKNFYLENVDFENIVQKAILPFMIFVYMITIAGSIFLYKSHNSFAIGDWLINYSGGFVRRGALGQIAIFLSKLTSFDPGIFVVLFHTFSYSIFFLFSYKLLRKQKKLGSLGKSVGKKELYI